MMPQVSKLLKKLTVHELPSLTNKSGNDYNNNNNSSVNYEEDNNNNNSIIENSLIESTRNTVSTRRVDNTIATYVDDSSSPTFQPPGHPKQAFIDGEIWPPIFKTEFVRSAKNLQLKNTDVFVVTYPKCGTTWLQHICSQLMSAEYGPEEGKELYLTSPMIERMGANFVDALKHPRLLKTHFNYANCPKSASAKYIFCVRNPKDCLTSYYFHHQLFHIYNFEDGDFSTFYELFLEGRIGFGCFFDHLKSWLPHVHDENVLFLKYEEMYADLESTIRKIGHFLGGRATQIVDNAKSLAEVVENSKMDSMKKDQKRFFSESSMRKKDGFIRKGGSRNWKKHMSREQSDRIDALFRAKLAGTPAENWWRYEMCWDDDEALTIASAAEEEIANKENVLVDVNDCFGTVDTVGEDAFKNAKCCLQLMIDTDFDSANSSGCSSPQQPSTSASSRSNSFCHIGDAQMCSIPMFTKRGNNVCKTLSAHCLSGRLNRSINVATNTISNDDNYINNNAINSSMPVKSLLLNPNDGALRRDSLASDYDSMNSSTLSLHLNLNTTLKH